MPLVAPHELIPRAHQERWAIGAFNTSNLEVAQAIAWGLKAARAPGFIQTSEAAIQYAGLTLLRDIIRDVATNVDVPIILHLDHGTSLEIVRLCLGAGYTSVMIDASALPFEENVALTKQAVTLAHALGVWVEGELGKIPGKEGLVARDGKSEEAVGDALLTDPLEAAEFVRETGVDALAISVGTAHGAFRGREGIRFGRLEEISRAVPVPLVLHGASGVPDSEIRRALQYGIAKVNIDTELREAFHDAVLQHQENVPEHSIDPRGMLAPAREAVQALVQQKAELLGGAGKF